MYQTLTEIWFDIYNVEKENKIFLIAVERVFWNDDVFNFNDFVSIERENSKQTKVCIAYNTVIVVTFKLF